MAFIFDAWSESYRESHSAGPVPMPMYRRQSREWIAWYLDRPGVSALVACNPEDETQLFGFLISETADDRQTGKTLPCIHYVFVKQPFRRYGLAKALLAQAGINPKLPFLFTHKTAVATKLLQRGRLPGKFSLYGRFPKKPTPSKETNEAQGNHVSPGAAPNGQPRSPHHGPEQRQERLPPN